MLVVMDLIFVSDDPSLRWSPMWSVGAKWNIGKEEFIKDIDWINYLNLRATYGINGNAEKSTSAVDIGFCWKFG